MQVHYDEGVANRIGPERCVVGREAGGEASAGGSGFCPVRPPFPPVAAKAGLHAIDLILSVQKAYGGFLPSSHTDDLPQLMADNDAVLRELRNEKG